MKPANTFFAQLKGVLIATIFVLISYSKWTYVSFLIMPAACSFFVLDSIVIGLVLSSALLLLKRRRLWKTIHLFVRLEFINELVLEPYSENWKKEVEQEKKRLLKIFAPYSSYFASTLMHVGSTSIEGIALAKPIHDMVIAVHEPLPEQVYHELRKLGYCIGGGASPHCPDGGDNWCIFVSETEEERKTRGYGFDIHICEPEAHEWARSVILFTQYMKLHPHEREEYEKVKRENASSMFKYGTGKTPFVLKARERMKNWQIDNGIVVEFEPFKI